MLIIRLLHRWWIGLWISQIFALLPPLSYFLVRLMDGPRLGWITIPVAILILAYTFFVVLMVVLRRGHEWIFNHRYQLLLAGLSACSAFVPCEIAAGFLWAHQNVWLFENSQATIHFDPIRGYRLEATPSRWACISHGTVEFVSALRGNNLGFPDRDDFGPAGPTQGGNALRYSAIRSPRDNSWVAIGPMP
jgi:hypothetical protein